MIMDARTIALENMGYKESKEKATKSLTKWGRFQIVGETANPDLIFVLTDEARSLGGRVSRTGSAIGARGDIGGRREEGSQRVIIITVLDGKTREQVWRSSPDDSVDLAGYGSNPVRQMKNVIEKEEKRLKKEGQ